MKPWPKDKTETVGFEALMKPLKKAVDFMYDLTRKNRDRDVPYNGYDIGQKEHVTVPEPTQMLSVEHLRYSEEQGVEPIEVILQIAFLLGMEQGRRYSADQNQSRLDGAATYLKLALEQIEGVQNG
jgi:hypothetical protein